MNIYIWDLHVNRVAQYLGNIYLFGYADGYTYEGGAENNERLELRNVANQRDCIWR